MNNPVDTLIEDPRWQALDLESLANDAARRTLRHLSLEAEAFELCLMACDDARIAELNGTFRDKPRPTNVLSWPSVDLAADTDGAQPALEAAEPELGDIAIAWETCNKEAEQGDIPLRSHVFHLLVHGMLHLLGYDHIRDKDAALMEALEVAILDEAGIADPYRVSEDRRPDDGM